MWCSIYCLILFAVLSGAFMEPDHCVINNQHGEVVLMPLDGAFCSVDNVRVHEPTKLKQGSLSAVTWIPIILVLSVLLF